MESINRCGWANNDPQYVSYHDTEWGVPVQTTDRIPYSGRDTAI
jgi:DNA-3-methyladenine glycosylase I